MGITQHTTGTDNVKSLANLAMLCGTGIEGGGVNPLRGQNNVQGACDMGGLPNVYSRLPEGDRSGDPAQKWNGLGRDRTCRINPGMTATEMVPKAHEGKLRPCISLAKIRWSPIPI